MDYLRICPFTFGLIDQTVAYGRYFHAARDWRVLPWAVVFFALCVIPAILLDISRLPTHIYEHTGSSNRWWVSHDSNDRERRNG